MKVGFTCGVFDLFHAGHVMMLQECRSHCDKLVVGLNTADNIDPLINPNKEKPIFNVNDRKLILESCRYVDEVIIYSSEDELLEILKKGKFDIRFLGEDYKGKQITGEALTTEIYWINRGHGLSSSGYKQEIRKVRN